MVYGSQKHKILLTERNLYYFDHFVLISNQNLVDL